MQQPFQDRAGGSCRKVNKLQEQLKVKTEVTQTSPVGKSADSSRLSMQVPTCVIFYSQPVSGQLFSLSSVVASHFFPRVNFCKL